VSPRRRASSCLAYTSASATGVWWTTCRLRCRRGGRRPARAQRRGQDDDLSPHRGPARTRRRGDLPRRRPAHRAAPRASAPRARLLAPRIGAVHRAHRAPAAPRPPGGPWRPGGGGRSALGGRRADPARPGPGRGALGRRASAPRHRALLGHAPPVLLLDEPFAGVDPVATQALVRRFRGLAAQGLGLLLTDHAAREALSACDEVVLLDQGRVVTRGPVEQVAADPRARARWLGDDF
jgi:hypothetical protein